MLFLNNAYRWCDDWGGGIVFAYSKDEAKEKLYNMYGESRNVEDMIIWSWTNDELFDEGNPDVFDIY